MGLTRRSLLSGLAAAPASAGGQGRPFVACYYFPNYHTGDPRNERVHGKGWSEWELVKKARPRFPGHEQPIVPAWGYTDESDPAAMARKIDAAADHGIDSFIFDWYWYDDGPFLERALDRGFLGARNNRRLKFGLMWANHDWVDIHPARLRERPRLLYPGVIKPETWGPMTEHIIERYFRHPSHWQIEGRPYFSVYEAYRLIQSFGGVEPTRRALDDFRARVRKAGFPGLHLNAVTWGVKILPGEQALTDVAGMARALGLDSVTSYVWIHHVPLRTFPETPYPQVMDAYLQYAATTAATFGVPYHPNATMGWDSSPRTHPDDPFENRGYPYMARMSGNKPEAWEVALRRCASLLDRSPQKDRVLTLNCWNEWTEGSYLEPDTRTGLRYLEAVRRVFPR